MIREQDLHEAIAECVGKKSPDANTCIKLAAYYTILRELYPNEQRDAPVLPAQSFAAEPEVVNFDGDSEFARLIRGQSVSYIMPIIDELMDAVRITQPRLYDGVMRRLEAL
jgi:hypothetical protein